MECGRRNDSIRHVGNLAARDSSQCLSDVQIGGDGGKDRILSTHFFEERLKRIGRQAPPFHQVDDFH